MCHLFFIICCITSWCYTPYKTVKCKRFGFYFVSIYVITMKKGFFISVMMSCLYPIRWERQIWNFTQIPHQYNVFQVVYLLSFRKYCGWNVCIVRSNLQFSDRIHLCFSEVGQFCCLLRIDLVIYNQYSYWIFNIHLHFFQSCFG